MLGAVAMIAVLEKGGLRIMLAHGLCLRVPVSRLPIAIALSLAFFPSDCVSWLRLCLCLQITFDPETSLLTMRGEKKEEEKEEGGKEEGETRPRSFRSSSMSFLRSFTLPKVGRWSGLLCVVCVYGRCVVSVYGW